MDSLDPNAPPAGTACPETDSGLLSLVMVLRFHQVAAEPAQLRHRLGAAGSLGSTDLLRVAAELGLKARQTVTSFERLERTPLPAIAITTVALSESWQSFSCYGTCARWLGAIASSLTNQ